jgi:hypothetical protein
MKYAALLLRKLHGIDWERLVGKGVGPRQVVDNFKKELKMRSIFRLSDAILGVKWAV